MSPADRFDLLATGPDAASRVLTALLAREDLAVAEIRHGRIRRSNPAWRALFGLRPDMGEPSILSVFPSLKSAERFDKLLTSSLDQGEARAEHLLAKSDGETFMASIEVNLLASDDSNTIDAVWQVRDLSSERIMRRETSEVEAYYRALATHQADVLVVLDAAAQIRYASPSVKAILGYDSVELVGKDAFSFFGDGDTSLAREAFNRILQARPDAARGGVRVQVRDATGAIRTLACRYQNAIGVASIGGIVINVRDMTGESDRQSQRAERLERAARLHEALFDLSTQAWTSLPGRIDAILCKAMEHLGLQCASFWRYDADHQALTCEARVLAPAGNGVRDPIDDVVTQAEFPVYMAEIHGHRPIIVNDIRSHVSLTAAHRARLEGVGVRAMLDFPVARGSQTLGLMSLECSNPTRHWDTDDISFAGGLSLLVALALEGAERDAVDRRMRHMAMHDALTGLANRPQAETILAASIETARVSHEPVSLLLLDLDEFKEINDTYGHSRGDALLVRVARSLEEAVPKGALVARMGGDEFVVIWAGADKLAAQGLAETIVARLGEIESFEQSGQHIGASVGVAVFPDDADDAETLLVNADIAMYQAKGSGRSQAFAFDTRLAQSLRLQRELDGEIRDALRLGQFSLFYQPQVDLRTGQVIGLEALLRWEHPRRGLMLPNTFMAAAERIGLIDGITKWAVTAVCDQNIAWARAGVGSLPIAVNVTGRQFHDRHLPATIASALIRCGLPASHLILEVTEESLIEASKTSDRVLSELRRLGVRIAIDDFGVGYSSLSYLRRLDVSQIKLDKTFIDGLPEDEESAVVVAAVIAIARRLHYQVIAEGVETEKQLDHLRSIGCEAGQGFLFGAPLSAEEITDFLADRRRAA